MGRRGVPTVRYQKRVGGPAERCLREVDVPDFQGFGIFLQLKLKFFNKYAQILKFFNNYLSI